MDEEALRRLQFRQRFGNPLEAVFRLGFVIGGRRRLGKDDVAVGLYGGHKVSPLGWFGLGPYGSRRRESPDRAAVELVSGVLRIGDAAR